MKSRLYLSLAYLGLCAQLLAKGSQDCPGMLMQGNPSDQYLKAGYNAPAAADIRGRCCSVSAFASASFLYWQVSEDGLGLATNTILSSGQSFVPTQVISIGIPFDYKPGFKVALGLVAQKEWTLCAEYTWLRGTNSTSRTPPNDLVVSGVSPSSLTGTPIAAWSSDDWIRQATLGRQYLSGPNIQGKWTYGIDMIDLMAGRPYYLGDRLIISPAIGLKALFIRQKMAVTLTVDPSLYGSPYGLPQNPPAQPVESITTSQSWALGPQIGFDVSCLLPRGFKIMGDVAGSVLYTDYFTLKHKEFPASTAYNPGPYILNDQVPTGALRPILEVGLGLGWSRYYCDQKYHFDFVAAYDFAVLWNQNMMRKILDSSVSGTNPSESDMYIQGLTVTCGLDF